MSTSMFDTVVLKILTEQMKWRLQLSKKNEIIKFDSR